MTLRINTLGGINTTGSFGESVALENIVPTPNVIFADHFAIGETVISADLLSEASMVDVFNDALGLLLTILGPQSVQLDNAVPSPNVIFEDFMSNGIVVILYSSVGIAINPDINPWTGDFIGYAG